MLKKFTGFLEVLTLTMLAFFAVATSFSAFAEAVVMPQVPWWVGLLQNSMKNFPHVNEWLVAFIMMFSLVTRGLSEFMFFVAAKTKTEKDDKWAGYFSKAAEWSGKFFGWFGAGTPKAVLAEQVQKEKLKDASPK